ncbi:unnamed protein product, partial [Linum tenue]
PRLDRPAATLPILLSSPPSSREDEQTQELQPSTTSSPPHQHLLLPLTGMACSLRPVATTIFFLLPVPSSSRPPSKSPRFKPSHTQTISLPRSPPTPVSTDTILISLPTSISSVGACQHHRLKLDPSARRGMLVSFSDAGQSVGGLTIVLQKLMGRSSGEGSKRR